MTTRVTTEGNAVSTSDRERFNPVETARRAQGAIGRHLSVRWKLTLWYGLMVGLTLSVTGLAMRQVLGVQTSRSIDGGLRSTAGSLLIKLHQPDSRYSRIAARRDRFRAYKKNVRNALNKYAAEVSFPGQFEQVQLVNLTTTPAHSPLLTPYGRTQVFIPQLLLSEVMAGKQPKLVPLTDGGVEYRVYLVPISVPARLRGLALGVLEVIQPKETYNAIQRDLDQILLFFIPLGVVIALLVGWWIARAALRPIDRISRTVQSIGKAGDLNRRLNFVGPNDELGRLAETFDDMMDRLQRVFETQKRFVADASHELRTPLTAIRGNADLMAYAPPEERDLCLATIRREAERMGRLVNELLLLAEADLEQQPMQSVPVELGPVMEDVYRLTLAVASDKVSVELAHVEPVTVQGDPDRLRQLVLNLADNAVKFTPPGGVVSLALYAEAQGARIEISDTGVGIPPEEQKAIFQRFYRVDEARGSRGSGLGLSIVSRIVSGHSGSIRVDSEPGKGTRFVVRLPGRLLPEPPPKQRLRRSGRGQRSATHGSSTEAGRGQ